MTASSSPGRGMTLAMAAATGLAVASIYYNQPMLGVMERAMPSSLTALVPMTTQLGYALGLFALVPLGDLLERRQLIVWQFVLLAAALAITALAPGAGIVLLGSLLIGAAATVAQQIVPFAAHLAPPERRGAVVGVVMSGLLCGILLSRTLAGFVADHAGWREMFWLGVPLSLGAGAVMRLLLPYSRPDTQHSYASLMASLVHLWREFPALRLAAFTQALLFGAFSVFWSILALHLQEPRFNLSAEAAGLFGIVGAVGILAAPLAGRFADRHGPHRAILAGTILTLLSWVLFGTWLSLGGLVVGCILLDFAVQSALVSHQHIVYALRPEARSRLNTLFMGVMFLGGATGAAGASAAWVIGGWSAVALFGGLMAAGALALQVISARS
ncbi:major facilitator superfamily sugar transporter [Acetobacter aceti NRIC 0242]|uniref:MFS transporter n=1 Tax=Acetobacter aceti NBRC 14818 TaxID=887700 RepID=A0AB33IF00_ACEAC|nr:MFS transporter [Acetobacter aceti]TCS27389.1 putative MFS family arabinose efflux permease [Acetobacter aceti NBRC 14818]BCK76735.1 MFS transporter [Acetobacter aceti NBRC 14818]GAN58648.1 major facilitator superfamily transporter [Acetobacter aceti NBRC 14818]GBO80596.1 major facilitator superfamily sugar transporter [Acetobacter aceti NRIC 0242]